MLTSFKILLISKEFLQDPKNIPIIVSIISLTGVLLSSIFGYISSYYGSKSSARNERNRIREAHNKRIEQENKFEKDRILREALQDLTLIYYNDTFNSDINSTYFNTEEGLAQFYKVMSKVTAYGSELSVHSVIYLQKAVAGALLLSDYQDIILLKANHNTPSSINWVKYEINAMAAIMISQLRYDISGETINPKELLSVKYNNLNRGFKIFFETGIDLFVQDNHLEHLLPSEGKDENNHN